jgi:hypothetical protein
MGGLPNPPPEGALKGGDTMSGAELTACFVKLHIICQIQESEITEILFLMEATKERDLHKSLKLLLKECEKGLPPPPASLEINLR